MEDFDEVYKSILLEGVKCDITGFWIVYTPAMECEVEEMLEYSSFSKLMEKAAKRKKVPKNIYGIYFDKSKATNIANRLLKRMRKYWGGSYGYIPDRDNGSDVDANMFGGDAGGDGGGGGE